MHVEIEVALNFIISYLYNKLPRRRVNIFGEELEKALKLKFQGHWYPDKPVKVRTLCQRERESVLLNVNYERREIGFPAATEMAVHAPGAQEIDLF